MVKAEIIMLIQLYEEVVNEDGTRTPGRIVGEIRCIGDGTPGEFVFFDTCNEIRDVRDKEDFSYNKNKVILSDVGKSMLEGYFEYPLNITVDGGEVDGVEFSVPATLQPWYRETIEYLLEYKVNGNVCGKIIED
jgi:hypothetical protein